MNDGYLKCRLSLEGETVVFGDGCDGQAVLRRQRRSPNPDHIAQVQFGPAVPV
jgi:hypothetical protein